ncbi:MAG: hypothetical protein ACR2JF_13475 [Iamia sp.]
MTRLRSAHRTSRRRPALAVAVVTVVALALAACGPITAPPDNPVHPRAVSTNPDDRTPHVLDGRVHAVLDLGDRVLIGGEFTTVKTYDRPTQHARQGLFAYDKATGAIDTAFVPALDRGGVRALAVSGDGQLLVGGSFQRVGGHFSPGLAKLDPSTGAPNGAFRGGTDGWVLTMVARGNRLFVGGTFTRVDGANRSRLAAVDSTTGAVDTRFDVPVDQALRAYSLVNQLDATRDGSRLVITGNFTRVGGQPRTQVAVIDVGSAGASVSSWATEGYRAGVCSSTIDYYVKDVDISPDDRFFAVVTTGAWRGLTTLCDTVARWELGPTGAGQQPTWADYTGGDSLSAVAITGSTLYAAGHQRWANNEHPPYGDAKGPGAVDRPGIAAYDSATGDVLPWAIDRERGLQVGTLTPTAQGLWIGSDSSRLGGEWHPRVSYLPL